MQLDYKKTELLSLDQMVYTIRRKTRIILILFILYKPRNRI